MWQPFKNRLAYAYYTFRVWKFRRKDDVKSSGRILLAGLLSSPNGIGEGARLTRSGLEGLNYGISTFDLSPVIQPDLSTIEVEPSAPDDENGPVILHVNPSEVPKALYSLRHRNLRNRRIIGVWAWELERPPAFWNFCAKWFDEIWAISDFMAESLSILSVPVAHIGYPIEAAPNNAAVEWREELNLGDAFTILIAFDSRSSLTRKNPLAAIEAFKRAFEGTPNVKLVVKISGPIEAVDRAAFEGDSIILLEKPISRGDMSALIQMADCHLSLSRAEGLGLVAAEAAANGTPVVITGWSGPSAWEACPNVYLVDYNLVRITDETNIYKHARDLRWAEPDIDDAVEKLRYVFEQSDETRATRSAQARAWWAENYSKYAFETRIPKSTLACFEKRKA